ncbi:hypothetical protein BC939DRAFT_447265 [Gamsiella multidivaricata]|uniref:uncharacterized protein n=1 Tax=Gamsiella multidivaricata TaxID=101098 RepID=UPI00221E960E|nr:uncharacterized protein BC939DRAFT_447265 [Gamsiella multidivaricata]KAI7826205.1 hypothetical protein BC939DRAFT_447265 [Gamsiella multidivaricata]
MEKESIFDSPLVKSEVAKYLSNNDLAQCALVSKKWSAWFLPALWRSIKFGQLSFGQLSTISSEGLKRHQGHIQSLQGYQFNSAAQPYVWSYPNLTSLEFGPGFGRHGRRVDLATLKMVAGSPHLEHLKISLNLDHVDVYQELRRVLQSLTRLKSLELHLIEFIEPVVIQDILEICSRVKFLSVFLQSATYFMPGDEGAQLKLATEAMKRMQDTQVQHLEFQATDGSLELSILPLFLKKCPMLESLSLPSLCQEQTMEQVVEIIKERTCPKLKHWSHGRVTYSGMSEDLFLETFRATKSGTGEYDSDGDWMEGGLKTIAVGYPVALDERVIRTITEYHGTTLTTMNTPGFTMDLPSLTLLLSGLPALKSLAATVTLPNASTHDPDLELTKKTSWACTGLKYLDVTCNTTGTFKVPGGKRWDASAEKTCTDYLFSQIGSLTQLEELILRTGMFDPFILKNGYLMPLSGLSNLKTLRLPRQYNIRMGVKEAEWMAENWTSLVYVAIEVVSRALVSDEKSREAFEATLKEKRPSVEIGPSQPYSHMLFGGGFVNNRLGGYNNGFGGWGVQNGFVPFPWIRRSMNIK